MRHRYRSLLVGAAAVCACSQPPRRDLGDDGWGLPEGVVREAPATVRRPPAPRAKPIPVERRKRWVHADELASLTQAGARGPSDHHDGKYERTVLINDAASAYLQLVRGVPLPPGAMIVQRHHPPGADTVVAYFVMRKLGSGQASASGDWEFSVVDEELRLAANSQLQACIRCHLDAPHDALFGPAGD